MADIFLTKDIKKLLAGKFVLILGDSNLRAQYRDMVWLLNNNKIVPESHLRRKLDFSYLGDRLLKQGELNRGRDYLEMREYSTGEFHIKFNFITRCITKEVEEMMNDYKEKKTKSPDIVLINSCLWDISRWGPDGVLQYKENMRKLFSLFKASLPPTTLVIFSTTPPVSPSCSAAFLVKQVEFMKKSLRFEVMEGNLFVRQLVPTYGYNVLDLHYHLRMQIHRRVKDGIHWIPTAVRHITNLFLTHISLCLNVPLPGNFEGKLLNRMKGGAKRMKDIMDDCTLPKLRMVKDPAMPPPPLPDRNKRWRNSNRDKWANIENVDPNRRFHSRYSKPQYVPQYANNWPDQNRHINATYSHRSVFGEVNPNVNFQTRDPPNQRPAQHAAYAPYCDRQPYVGPHWRDVSYNENDQHEHKYGPHRYRDNHRYAYHMKPY
ncbi:PC-esterase domain-containing protein 1A-like [Hetaerina americana]|uniref:PC-esterase domain-containing protein 1A-like n=1 Tax=Hetaerina americana TaxID=62018 RepID=UPI003A7F2C85